MRYISTACGTDCLIQVLLYNFFEDSAVDVTRWRVLLNHAEGEVDGRDLTKVHAPSFGRDEGRFAGVCSEVCEFRDILQLLPDVVRSVKIAIRWHHPSEEELVDL